MENYAIFMVEGDSGGVRLHSTDSTELEKIIAEMKKHFPTLHFFSEDKLLSGELYFCWIDRLKNRDVDALWWIIKQLCSRGWEPLGAVGSVSGNHNTDINTDIQYIFRRKG